MAEKRKNLMEQIHSDYIENGKHRMKQAEQKNVMLIGRTRTGKSTLKSMLADPTYVSDELTLCSGRKEPLFESFQVGDNNIFLNIIDTPGLFERGASDINVRDNETILHTIEMCVNREVTKIHVICFCISLICGIGMEDIQSLKLLFDFLGNAISKNCCLIITRCESRNETQRARIREELLEDQYFREIAPFFKLGIFFSGALDRDDFNRAHDSLLDQYFTISDYRMELIELFTSDIEPFPISDMLISHVRQARDEASRKDYQLQALQARADEQANNLREREECTPSQNAEKGLKDCHIS